MNEVCLTAQDTTERLDFAARTQETFAARLVVTPRGAS